MQMQPPQKWLGIGSLLGGLMAYRRQPACARNLSKVVRHLQGRSSISKQQVRTGSTAVVDIKDAIRNDLKQLNIDLEGLLPDSSQLLNSPKRGAVERGEKWEEMVANSLAARFRLLCIARNLRAEVTWVPFLEIYPTKDPHLRAVLEPFEVCWSDGVEYPSGEGNEATVMSDVGKAIKSNRNFCNDSPRPCNPCETQLQFIASAMLVWREKGCRRPEVAGQSKEGQLSGHAKCVAADLQ